MHKGTEKGYLLLNMTLESTEKMRDDGSMFSIDHSHDVPEIEFLTEEGAKRYLRFLKDVESGQHTKDKRELKELKESVGELKNGKDSTYPGISRLSYYHCNYPTRTLPW